MCFKFESLVPVELETGSTGPFFDFIETYNFGNPHEIGIIFNGLICYRHHHFRDSRLGWVMINANWGRWPSITIVSNMWDKAGL